MPPIPFPLLRRDPTPVQIMPKPTLISSPPSSSISAEPPIRKKRRVVERRRSSPACSPLISPSPSPPPTAQSRKRTPALERLPRWLFLPRRHFVAAHGALPLPQKVAVRGKPFYDWDAWAVTLLSAELWRRRGPWQRLIACCAAAKPPHVDLDHVPDVKASLVRIVVAEVVSQLVSRSGDALTPEDRNWITSVASRQRGRHAKKPTLMLLFDLAFAVFDLAAFCRRGNEPSTKVVLDQNQKNDARKATGQDHIVDAVRDIVANAWRTDGLPTSSALNRDDPLSKLESSHDSAKSIDPVVCRILHVVYKREENASDSWIIDNVKRVIDVMEDFLTVNKAHRWHHFFTSKVEAAKDGVMQATQIFSQRLPLTHVKSVAQLRDDDAFSEWLWSSLNGPSWVYWAELANDCNYVILTGTIAEKLLREMACRSIVSKLIANANLSVDTKLLDSIVKKQLCYDEKRLTIARLLDMALGLENFYSFFVETYANDTATGSCIAWGILCFEGLVQLLARLREVLIAGTARERAMIDWSARSLDISKYYREAMFGNQLMREDIERAIQSAFSEASWMLVSRPMRYMVHAVPQMSAGSENENSQMPRFWVASLDLNDSVNLATAIVPWDPRRALNLLDQAIGLSENVMRNICNGTEGLPLWDFRRINVCRLLSFRGNPHQTALIMERLQLLFDQKSLHEGGNFSEATLYLLEAAAREHNFCAQTTLGLLLAGQGTYWDVARSWAGCEKLIAVGMGKLYLSAEAGDLEACTALSHIWAQSGPEKTEVFETITIQQVHKLFKIAVTSQNAKAVMNMGVIWRYGNSCVTPDRTVATDAFLIALQGGVFGEARTVAARHLAEMIGQGQADVAKLLAVLANRTGITVASSPYRIDDFRGSSE